MGAQGGRAALRAARAGGPRVSTERRAASRRRAAPRAAPPAAPRASRTVCGVRSPSRRPAPGAAPRARRRRAPDYPPRLDAVSTYTHFTLSYCKVAFSAISLSDHLLILIYILIYLEVKRENTNCQWNILNSQKALCL